MANPLQERYAEVLLDRIRGDRHPSAMHMDLFEAIAPPEQRAEYTLHLMELIQRDQYPSVPIMRRVEGLVASFGR